MRFIVHPLYLFEIFTRNVEVLEYSLERFKEVTRDSVILHLSITCFDNLSPEAKRLHKDTDKYFRKHALHHIDYPTEEHWKYSGTVDDIVLGLPKEHKVVFCGGYVENCLARAYGAFEREYKSYCKENEIVIKIDRSRAYCAGNTYTKDQLFLDTRSGHELRYSEEEFEWWSRQTRRPLRTG